MENELDSAGNVRTTVTVIFTNANGEEFKLEFPIDSCDYKYERGIARRMSDGKVVDIMPNGQVRLTLKAWKGCPSFDSFITGNEV